MTADADVIVVGGGHNGLVCGALLARSGWRVLVLERSGSLGGATTSAELTLPGVVHDVMATNVGGFSAGPVWARLGSELQRHGLTFAVGAKPFASAFGGARALRVHGGLESTLEELRRNDPDDVAGWQQLTSLFRASAPSLFGALRAPMPSVALGKALLGGRRSMGSSQALEVLQLLASCPRDLGDAYLHSPEAKSLLAAWSLHSDFGPDQSAGTLLPFIESFGDMDSGMSLIEGGIGRLPAALASVIADHGGEVRTDAEVSAIEVSRGRATHVVIKGNERLSAREAVVACTTPRALVCDLLRDADLDLSVRRAASQYGFGPGTMMVHLALRGPLQWEAGEDLAEFSYVHLGPYVEDLALAYTQARNGLLPTEPLLVVGQPTAVDRSRAPDGVHVLWVQVRAVPAEIRGDAAGTITERDWSTVAEPFADRVMAKLERFAPGVAGLVIDRAVLTPADLERRNPNLVGGDNGAGSGLISQNLVFRPLAGWSRHRTPVDGLYMTGAATWPGPGVTGLPGMQTADRVLRDAGRIRRMTRRVMSR